MNSVREKLARKIRELRERHSMSQQELADLLEVSRPTISQIETAERNLSPDELIRLSEIFGIPISALLGLVKEPEILLKKKGKKKSKKKREEPQIRINVPQRNLDKFKEVLLYILKTVGSQPNIGETVIYKLLYFIDFDYYEKYEEQLIGATYIRNKYGPTPLEFRSIIDEMIADEEVLEVKTQYFKHPQRKYLPLREPDLSILKANEKDLIDDVLARHSGKNAVTISNWSHNDVPWLTTENGGIIEYEAVFYRTAPYSVRESCESEDV